MDAVNYLTEDDLVYIHLYVVERVFEGYGGRFGVLDQNGVDRAANRARQSFDGRDLFPTLEEKVAALADSVIRSHPFVDANKRTGMAAAMVMFERNGQTVIAESDDMYDLALQVEAGHVTVQDLAEWFADPINVLPLTEDEAEAMERLLDLDPFNRWEEEE